MILLCSAYVENHNTFQIFTGRSMPSGTKSAGFLGHKTQDGLQGSQSKRQGRADRQGDMYNMKWPPFDNVSFFYFGRLVIIFDNDH